MIQKSTHSPEGEVKDTTNNLVDSFFGGDFYDSDFDNQFESINRPVKKAKGPDDRLPDSMFSAYDDFYYDVNEGGSSRQKRDMSYEDYYDSPNLVSRYSAEKCEDCESSNG